MEDNKKQKTEKGTLFFKQLEGMISEALEGDFLTEKERELVMEVQKILSAQHTEDSKPIVVNKVFSSEDYSDDETSIIVPEGVIELEYCCFRGCSDIKEIILPSTLQEIGGYAFDDCSGLTSIDIPNNVTSLGHGVFRGCSSLKSINISSVTSIGDDIFRRCKNLSSIIINLSDIEKEIFDDITNNVRTIELGENVRKIYDQAFFRCKKLKELVIRNGVEEIGEDIVFDTKIKKLFLPPTVRRIGQNDNIDLYCYAPELEDMEDLAGANFFVLPQYLQAYQDQAKAEDIDVHIQEIPEEFRYYYDN